MTVLTPKTYEAQASMLITGGAAGSPSGILAQSLVPTIARLAETREVALGAATQAGLPDSQVIGHITAASQPGMQIITLTARAGAAEKSATIVNAAAHFLSTNLPTWLSKEKDAPTVQVLDKATSPMRPVTPIPLLNYALGGLLGLLTGIGFTSMHRRLDDRLRWPTQIEAELGLPVLAAISGLPRWLTRRGARSAYRRKRVAGAVREAVATLTVLTHASNHKRLLVTGVREDGNRAMVTALLALGLAERHDRVTLIDGHLRRSALSRHFPETAEHSLQQVLTDAVTPLPQQLASPATLSVLAAESTDALQGARLLRSQPFAQLLDKAATQSDVLLVHAPAVLDSADIAVLANHTDAAVIMVRAGTTRTAEARRAVLLLQRLGTPIVGVLIISATGRRRHTLGWPHSSTESAVTSAPSRLVPLSPHLSAASVSAGLNRQTITTLSDQTC
ncbi:hypothetical protein QMK19_07250 [Streptomyces sp. H10-C2]|uniref:hypothetical protein n=1 Tax=unclassified Streptomyces TaxID=2593676 RepID=UPI0024BB6E74|nr:MULTISPECIES: hypothetical protein [unclassified Streptomyces]MDJ0341174.1 hypothetical protein [Streptomyces sp. PH10-H1]MDJ0369473.1 hypothetical protein [Streptomyces sp. H10-C2]